MDLKYFQRELQKYPVARRSDYCKTYLKKVDSSSSGAAKVSTAPAGPSADTKKTIVESKLSGKDIDVWTYLNAKLNSDEISLTADEKEKFLAAFQDGHRITMTKLNLEDLEGVASALAE